MSSPPSPVNNVESQNATGEDYDPHLHRQVKRPTTNGETLIHLLKCSLGTGILAMPQAFNNAGLVIGFIGTLLIGLLCTYCLHQLVNNQYVLCKRKKVPLLSYPRTMELAFLEGPKFLHPLSKWTVYLVDGFLVVYQMGICCVYIVFVAASVKEICDTYIKMSLETYMFILLLPFIGMNCIRNLKLLAPFSTLANVFTFIGLGIVIYYLVTNIPEQELSMWGSAATFPLFFGTTLFALEAVGVVIALEANMETPKSFGGWFGVLNQGMSFITILYAIIGLLGYMRFGDKCEGSITLNLPKEVLSQLVNVLYAIAVFISYGLQCYVPVEILWNTYILKRLESSKHLLLWEFGLRIAIVILTFVLAVSIPLLGLFISLFGAFCLSLLGIAFPALLEICVVYPNFGPMRWKLLKNIILIIIGILGLIVGTTTTLIEIVRALNG